MAENASSASGASPAGFRWLTLKEMRLEVPGGAVSERTAEGWCLAGRIVARKLAGTGHWRVQVDAEGFPVEASRGERGPRPKLPRPRAENRQGKLKAI